VVRLPCRMDEEPALNSNPLKRLRSKHWFALVVLLPALLALIYYVFVASDQYLSESRFVIKNPTQRPGQVTTIASLLQTTGLSGGEEQTNEVLDYVRSRNALADLQKRVDVRARFGRREIDWLARFPAPWREDGFENLYRYYGGRIDAHLDNETGTAVLRVRAFTAGDAQEINAALLDLSEALVNRLNERAEGKAIAEAEGRVAYARQRARTARLALREYRNRQGLVDPAEQARGVLEVTSKLIIELAALKSQLELMQRAAPANPAIPAVRNRIAAIDRQIEAQTGRAVGTSQGIASKLGGYENLALDQQFSTQMLNIASASLEQARTEAARQKYYLERIVQPNMADLALYPERLKSILVVAAAALFLYMIGWMLVTGILEHAPEA